MGDWLQLPLPASAPVMLPRLLMMNKGVSAYALCYAEAATFLRGICGAGATIEDLP